MPGSDTSRPQRQNRQANQAALLSHNRHWIPLGLTSAKTVPVSSVPKAQKLRQKCRRQMQSNELQQQIILPSAPEAWNCPTRSFEAFSGAKGIADGTGDPGFWSGIRIKNRRHLLDSWLLWMLSWYEYESCKVSTLQVRNSSQTKKIGTVGTTSFQVLWTLPSALRFYRRTKTFASNLFDKLKVWWSC